MVRLNPTPLSLPHVSLLLSFPLSSLSLTPLLYLSLFFLSLSLSFPLSFSLSLYTSSLCLSLFPVHTCTLYMHFIGEQISMRDIKDFPLRLWIIFMVCVAYYVTVFPFIGLAVIFLMEKYGYEAKEANIVNSLVRCTLTVNVQNTKCNS